MRRIGDLLGVKQSYYSDHNARSSLAALTGLKELKDVTTYPTVQDALHQALSAGRLQIPASCQAFIYVPDRQPWLADANKGSKSVIYDFLSAHTEETGLVVDAVRQGQDSLYVCRLIRGPEDVVPWLKALVHDKAELHLFKADDEYNMLLVPLKALVPRWQNC